MLCEFNLLLFEPHFTPVILMLSHALFSTEYAHSTSDYVCEPPPRVTSAIVSGAADTCPWRLSSKAVTPPRFLASTRSRCSMPDCTKLLKSHCSTQASSLPTQLLWGDCSSSSSQNRSSRVLSSTTLVAAGDFGGDFDAAITAANGYCSEPLSNQTTVSVGQTWQLTMLPQDAPQQPVGLTGAPQPSPSTASPNGSGAYGGGGSYVFMYLRYHFNPLARRMV